MAPKKHATRDKYEQQVHGYYYSDFSRKIKVLNFPWLRRAQLFRNTKRNDLVVNSGGTQSRKKLVSLLSLAIDLCLHALLKFHIIVSPLPASDLSCSLQLLGNFLRQGYRYTYVRTSRVWIQCMRCSYCTLMTAGPDLEQLIGAASQ